MKYLTTKEFRDRAQKQKGLRDAVSRGAFGSPEPLEDRQVKFVLSTQDPDREFDTVDPEGVRLDNYLRNPIVLWGHDSSCLPVGKCVGIGVEAGRLVGTVQFAGADANPHAEQVLKLVLGGYLSAVSIGFKPMDYDFNESGGMDFKECELLEFSIVNIPCNPDALAIDLPEEAKVPEGVELGQRAPVAKGHGGARRERILAII